MNQRNSSLSAPFTAGPVIFTHIPKTAGSTFGGIIWRHWCHKLPIEHAGIRSGIARFPRPEGESGELVHLLLSPAREGLSHLLKMPESYLRRTLFLAGHLGVGVHHHLPTPATYATFLRHPLERAVSQYYFNIRNRNPSDPTLKTIVECLEIGKLRDNQHVRSLLTARENEPVGMLNSEHLKEAESNLAELFSFVGITEKFDESLLLFRDRFGWGGGPYIRERLNQARPPLAELPQETLRLLERYHELDLSLYEKFRGRFEEQIKEAGPSFQSKLEEFRRLNSRYTKPEWDQAAAYR